MTSTSYIDDPHAGDSLLEATISPPPFADDRDWREFAPGAIIYDPKGILSLTAGRAYIIQTTPLVLPLKDPYAFGTNLQAP